MSKSKAMRDEFRLKQRPPRYYTLAELSEASHPYRQLFAKYEVHLRRLDVAAISAGLARLQAVRKALRTSKPE